MNIPSAALVLAVFLLSSVSLAEPATTTATTQTAVIQPATTQPIQITVTMPQAQNSGGDSEWFKTTLTAVIGAIIGIISFIASQFIQRIFIEPIQEQRKIVGRVANAIVFWANVWEMPVSKEQQKEHQETLNEASDAIRLLASDLKASIRSIPFYDCLARMNLVVPRADIGLVSYLLMGWQVRMQSRYILFASRDIQKILKIDYGDKAAAKAVEEWVKKNGDITGDVKWTTIDTPK